MAIFEQNIWTVHNNNSIWIIEKTCFLQPKYWLLAGVNCADIVLSGSSFHPRTVTKTTANQKRQWDNQLIRDTAAIGSAHFLSKRETTRERTGETLDCWQWYDFLTVFYLCCFGQWFYIKSLVFWGQGLVRQPKFLDVLVCRKLCLTSNWACDAFQLHSVWILNMKEMAGCISECAALTYRTYSTSPKSFMSLNTTGNHDTFLI